MKQDKANALADIVGNATKEHKLMALGVIAGLTGEVKHFADGIGSRLKVTEVSVLTPEYGPKKRIVRVVCDIMVTEDMTQNMGIMHGGCASYLVDVCSSIPLPILGDLQGGSATLGVSQSLNILFHAPAPKDSLLKIVSTTTASGSRSVSSRAEIWDATHGRLVVSGTHLKMEPSAGRQGTERLFSKL